MDATVMPDESPAGSANELPVDLESLMIEGSRPEVGDSVEIQVQGSVTRVVNETAYVRPERINGQDMPSAPLEVGLDEDSRLESMAQSAGGIPGY